ncbi:MAG: 6-carboxytetrahydropterin synthase [Planctomycetota bacterium]
MYEIRVEHEFCAAHAIRIGGEPEPLHGHNWRIAVVIEGERLDEDGLLCDFHTIESHLRQITEAWENRNLNECEPFVSGTNPSAELVCRAIYDRLSPLIANEIRIASVRVTEAPGCAATYRPR